MTDERNLTEDAQHEQHMLQQWAVQGYNTIYSAGMAILRGFGLPGEEAPAAFTACAAKFAEDILSRDNMPVHVKRRVLEDLQQALDNASTYTAHMRQAFEAEQAEIAKQEQQDLNAAPVPASAPETEAAAGRVVEGEFGVKHDEAPRRGDDGGNGNDSGSNGGNPPVTH